MKKLSVALGGLVMVSGLAYSAPVHDWHDLDRVHQHIVEAIHEMERAAKVNHYDMAGHGARAEQLLRDAEHELHEAVEAARNAH
jgi:hypothetical protein